MSGSLSENPYVGPRPFEAGETLYGREREITELIYRLNAERIVLLHSPSGAGKTSLVQAGLVPELAKSFDVWGPVRVNQEPAVAGVNRYVASAIQGFEEGIPEKIRRPAEELAALTLAGYFAKRPRRRSAPRNVLLVFDQFEEVLTVDPLAVEAKRELFDQLGELLRNPRVWALFVLREDYLAPLDPYARQVPTQLKNRFRIDLLGLDAAREAMVRTAYDGGRTFPAADRLVHDLATMKVQQADGSFVEETGRHVEPVQLQVVCRRLWDKMPTDDLSIDPEDLERFGDVTKALAAYYADSVAKIAAGDRALERSIRDWFGEELITESDIRGQVLRGPGASGGLANELIERLLDTHLIRAEKRAGATWYELAHDRLVEPVRDDNAAWGEAHLSEVQRRASLWERQDRPPGLLLADEELAKGERWAGENEAGLTEVERGFLDASREAQAVQILRRERKQLERDRRQARRIRRLAYAAMLVGAIALVASVSAGLQWREAEEQKQEADKQKQEAERQRLIAENQRQVAEEEKEEAKRQKLIAEEQKLEAKRQQRRAEEQRLRAEELARAAIASNLLAEHESTQANLLLLEVSKPKETPTAETTLHRALAASVSMMSLQGHTGSVNAASFSPDGARIVTASSDKTARIWDAATGAEIATLKGHRDDVNAASFSPDGARIVTASDDQTARIWNVARGAEIATLNGHTGSVNAASFSPDGARIVTASDDQTARIWTVGTDAVIVLEGHTDRVYAASFSPDGARIVTASRDQTARIWDAATEKEIATLKRHTAHVTAASFSPDGARIVTASWDRTARIWDSETGAEIATLRGHTYWVTAASFSSDGGQIVTASFDGTARIWDASTGAEIATLKEYMSLVCAASFSPDGARIVTSDGTARIWEIRTGPDIATLEGHTDWVTAASFSPDGAQIFTASKDHTARIWDVETGAEIGTLRGLRKARMAFGAQFSPDGTRFVRVVLGTADVRDVETRATIATLKGPYWLDAAFSPDGARIVTVSRNNTAQIWDAKTLEKSTTLKGHHSSLNAAAFSPDGARIVTTSWDRTARIWDSETGDKIAILKGHRDGVIAASFSPDGARIVTASWDRTARIWDAATGKEIATLKGHTSSVTAASFSPDGARIVTGSKDGTVRIWATADDYSEYLQSRIRARTRLCLSPDFRQQTLGETRADAERRHDACEACVAGFFERLGDAPLGEWQVYVEAWRPYKKCFQDRAR